MIKEYWRTSNGLAADSLRSVRISCVLMVVQKPLPKLPVPKLSETLDKYLLSLKAVVSDDQYERARHLANEFGRIGGVGETLQRRLEEFASTTDNWVSRFNEINSFYCSWTK